MTPEERELLTQALKLAEENNKILHGLRRRARLSSVLRVIYWLIIIGTAFGAYYFIQPYIDALGESYSGLKANIESVTKLPSLPTWLGGN